MDFNLSIWKQRAGNRLHTTGKWLKQHASESASYITYSALCTLSLWPLIEAAQQGQVLPVMIALGSVAGGVGGNLIANQIQQWKDHADGLNEEEVTSWVAQSATNTDVRHALDAILTEMRAITVAQERMNESAQVQFIEQLRRELKQLGNQRKFRAELTGSGAIAQGRGALAVGARGVATRKGIRNSTVITGNRNVVRNGGTNIHARTVNITKGRDDKAKPSIKLLRETYLKRLMADVAPLRLSGIDPKVANERQSSELQLAAVYTTMFIRQPQLEEPAQIPDILVDDPHRIDVSLHAIHTEVMPLDTLTQRTGRVNRRYQSVLVALDSSQHLVLLGDPGSGKSTSVNFIALCMAGQLLNDTEANLKLLRQELPQEAEGERSKKHTPQSWHHGALLPVRVVLRDLAVRGLPPHDTSDNGDVLWRFIVSELGESLKDWAEPLRKTLLKGGLILLDGLDEVPDANQCREQVKMAVQGFARDFPNCRILVTSRTYAYQRQDWKLNGFAEVMLSPFERWQINYFIDRWYAHVGPLRGMSLQDAEGKAEVLKTAIERTERLAELATNPLLLTLMASLHAWRGGNLPERREELYAASVDLLLDQWESQKLKRRPNGTYGVQEPSLAEYLKVPRDVIRTKLNRIAFEVHRDQPKLSGTADIPHERLIKALLDVARVHSAGLDKLDHYLRERCGLLAERATDVYAFPHRTFQEYLVACYLTDADFPRQLVDLVQSDPERWREVTLLAGAKAYRGTTSAIWNLVEVLCPADPPTEPSFANEAACLKALLAAQTLLENEGDRLTQIPYNVDAWNLPKLNRVHNWMRAIVSRGWLAPHDRAQAGAALAMLGDDRDLEELIVIPAGPFLMGSADSDTLASNDEKPQHEVSLATYKIGKYPVTCAQYLRFIKAEGRYWGLVEGHQLEHANRPAVFMTWYDARDYCDWLTEQWRVAGRISQDEVVRLPTEAEWEKAARGTDGRLWPWGNDWADDIYNSTEPQLDDTTPVGMFPYGASPYGCLDMYSNVLEWTSSLWGDKSDEPAFEYPYNPIDGRENLDESSDTMRVLRGGINSSEHGGVRCASRSRSLPRYYEFGGIRVVVSPIPGAKNL